MIAPYVHLLEKLTPAVGTLAFLVPSRHSLCLFDLADPNSLPPLIHSDAMDTEDIRAIYRQVDGKVQPLRIAPDCGSSCVRSLSDWRWCSLEAVFPLCICRHPRARSAPSVWTSSATPRIARTSATSRALVSSVNSPCLNSSVRSKASLVHLIVGFFPVLQTRAAGFCSRAPCVCSAATVRSPVFDRPLFGPHP